MVPTCHDLCSAEPDPTVRKHGRGRSDKLGQGRDHRLFLAPPGEEAFAARDLATQHTWDHDLCLPHPISSTIGVGFP